MNANTLEVPIYWNRLNPSGKFDFSLVDTLLKQDGNIKYICYFCSLPGKTAAVTICRNG